MELQTISQISKTFQLSTRTLRYYEQIGLIRSERKEDYAYRVYSEETIKKLQQIVILRKLRIPLKEIANILHNNDMVALLESFQKNLTELDEEITALSTIRDIITRFVERLNENIHSNVNLALFEDTKLLEEMDLLAIQKVPIKEEKTMGDLHEAEEKLFQLTDKDVRIIYVPSMTVASIYVQGQDEHGNHAEVVTDRLMKEFIEKSNLKEVYPEARYFGFNRPDGVPDEDPQHGYENWVSIPEDMEVPAPFVKKSLKGGTYAAHVIAEGAWDEGWMPLHTWVNESPNYDFRWETVEGVCGWLEESLNRWDWCQDGSRVNQIDLLMPVQPR